MAFSGGSSHAQNVTAQATLTQQQQATQLAQQQQAAQLQSAQDAARIASQGQVAAIQQSVSVDTWNLLKQFGQRAAVAGANLSVPLSSTTGGFVNPPATASGTPR